MSEQPYVHPQPYLGRTEKLQEMLQPYIQEHEITQLIVCARDIHLNRYTTLFKNEDYPLMTNDEAIELLQKCIHNLQITGRKS